MRQFRPDAPPAVLLGGLNVTRAAALGRIQVIVAAAQSDAPAFHSRHCSMALRLPPLEQPQAVVAKLLQLGECLSGALGRRVPLFYGDDDYLNLILEYRAQLAAHYRFILNEPQVAQALIDKERFDAFAAQRGLPVPRRLVWEELDSIAGPVLIKPKLKLAWEHSKTYLRLFGGEGKARVFADARELARHPLARALKDDLIFQEYVCGTDRDIWSFHGFADENARILAWFVGRKVRTYPPLTGVSTYVELAHHTRLAELGHSLVARAPLKGVFKIDFKHDAQRDRWFVLEVNARFNLWHYPAARNGINIPRVAYDYLVHGRRPGAQRRYATTYRWQSLGLDYRAFRALSARGEASAWDWLVTLLTPKVHDLFSWTDPVPFLMHLLRRLKRLPRFTARRITRWLFTVS